LSSFLLQDNVNIRKWKGKQVGIKTQDEKYVSTRSDDLVTFAAQFGESETFTVETVNRFIVFPSFVPFSYPPPLISLFSSSPSVWSIHGVQDGSRHLPVGRHR
jgi:hypothetical protein